MAKWPEECNLHKNLHFINAVLRIRDVYPGSDFFISRIRIKEFSTYFNPKKRFLSSRKSWLFIPDPDPDFLPIPDPGVKKAPDPGSGSATLY
jgi:hypothetical protein